MKIIFEYRGLFTEYYNQVVDLEELRALVKSAKEEGKDFGDYLIQKAYDDGDYEIALTDSGEPKTEIIKVYTESENSLPNNNSERISWEKNQGSRGWKVNFSFTENPGFKFLTDLYLEEILTENESKENKKNGVKISVQIWYRGVIRFNEVEIKDNSFDSNLFKINQNYNELGIDLEFYYDNELLNTADEEVQSDGKGSDWTISSCGIVEQNDIDSILSD